MKKKLIVLSDELAKELEPFPNQSDVIRKSLEFYIGHITPDTVDGLRAAYKIITLKLKEIDSKVDYLAGKVK